MSFLGNRIDEKNPKKKSEESLDAVAAEMVKNPPEQKTKAEEIRPEGTVQEEMKFDELNLADIAGDDLMGDLTAEEIMGLGIPQLDDPDEEDNVQRRLAEETKPNELKLDELNLADVAGDDLTGDLTAEEIMGLGIPQLDDPDEEDNVQRRLAEEMKFDELNLADIAGDDLMGDLTAEEIMGLGIPQLDDSDDDLMGELTAGETMEPGIPKLDALDEEYKVRKLLAEKAKREKAKLDEANSAAARDKDLTAKKNEALVKKDIDKQLLEMVKSDEIAEEEREGMEEVELDFVSDVSVYDNIEREDIEVGENSVAKNRPKPKLNLNLKELIERLKNADRLIKIGAVIIAVLFLFIIVAAAVLISALTGGRNTKADSGGKPQTVVQPVYVFNNANNIYVDQEGFVNNEKITLLKIVADELATVFYFKEAFDAEKLDFMLKDSGKGNYTLDLAAKGDSIVESITAKTVIRFRGLEKNVKSFELTVTDPVTGSNARFSFDLAEQKDVPAKYVNDPAEFGTNFTDISAKLESAQFSSSGSAINFSFSWENDNETIYFGEGGSNYNISMKQAGTAVVGLRAKPSTYLFEDENMILGRMDFAPVKNLSGKVDIVFTDLYKKFVRNTEYSVQSLYNRNEERIKLDHYTVVLEGIDRQGDYYVLPLHAENESIFAKSSPASGTEAFNRIDTYADVVLYTMGGDGEVYEMEGVARHDDRGCDVLFDVSGDSLFANAPVSALRIEVRNIYMKMTDLEMTLNLSEAYDRVIPARKRTVEELEQHFITRLDYTAGLRGINDISGFSVAMLSDKALMENYAPLAGLSGKPSYSAQVEAYVINGDKMEAVVKEALSAFDGKEKLQYLRTHLVVCRLTEKGLTVISDKID